MKLHDLIVCVGATISLASCGTSVHDAATACRPVTSGVAPASLQATGCFDSAGVPDASLFAYNVNAPLWADGASKKRWLVVPDGAHATFTADGVMTLPAGGAVFKEFSIDGVRMETRMIVAGEANQLVGYSYAWNNAQSAATLLADGAQGTVGGHAWTFPSRAQCFDCHNAEAGGLLGVRIPELNLVANAHTRLATDQLQELVATGVIPSPVKNPTAAWPDPLGSAPLAQRARSYLAANCSFCHRPDGLSGTATNFLYDAPLAQMGLCNLPANRGTFGIDGAQLLIPGDPTRSILSYRIHSTDVSARMPPLGRALEDTQAAAVIDAWITSLSSCNE